MIIANGGYDLVKDFWYASKIYINYLIILCLSCIVQWNNGIPPGPENIMKNDMNTLKFFFFSNWVDYYICIIS